MKQLLKEIVRAIPGFWSLRRCWLYQRQKQKLARWERNGKPVPPPHIVKEQTLEAYGKQYGLRILVETGTFLGDTVDAMKNNFDRIYSIELNERFFKQAQRRFKGVQNIELIQGDSGRELGKVVSKLNRPALFWLDGHYSGGITARGEKDTPIYEELNHIFNSPEKNHVIVIDDAHCFGTDPGYPTLQQLFDFVKSRSASSEVLVQDNSIRITPGKKAAQ